MADIYRSEKGKREILERYREILGRWPVENKQYFVDTSHGKTFVIESGEKENPPLLLFHGSVSNSFVWYGDVERLSKHFNIFAVDIIGEAGFSDPERPDYESGSYGKWIKELVKGLSLEKVSLAGMSLGGWMALDFAIQYPSMVDKLILLCTSGLAKVRSDFIFRLIFYALCGRWGKNEIIKMLNGGKFPDLSESGLEEAFSYTMFISENFRPRKTVPDFKDRIKSLDMPVLCVFGEKDCIIDVKKSVENLRKYAPRSEIVVLPDTGHVLTNQIERMIDFMKNE